MERQIFIYDTKVKKPSENLAINWFCRDKIKDNSYDLIARVYSHLNGVILGRFESAQDVNEEFCRENGYEIVKRPSGGSAIITDPSLVLCYSIFFSADEFGFGSLDHTKVYESIAIPLAENLGEMFSVEGAYYLRVGHNGSSLPIAGHAIRIEDGIVQFDGVVNRTAFDMDQLSKVLKLRNLYSFNDQQYVVVDNQVFDLKGKKSDVDISKAKLLRSERDELEKMVGLRDINMEDNHFVSAFLSTLRDVFGVVERVEGLDFGNFVEDIAEEIRRDSFEGQRVGLGHCFVDLVEPEPKVHHAV